MSLVRWTTLGLVMLMVACQVPLPEIDLEEPGAHSTPQPDPKGLEPTVDPGEINDPAIATKWLVTVYYRHPVVLGMLPVKRDIWVMGNTSGLVKQVIDQLTLAPEGEIGVPIWPANTYVREVYLLESEGVLVVDFNAAFVASLSVNVVDEELMVYSLVNSLLENFSQYESVRILVGGRTRETFMGHVDIETPLGRRYTAYNIIPEPLLSDEIIREDLAPLPDDPNN